MITWTVAFLSTLLAFNMAADDFLSSWKPGQTETLQYNMLSPKDNETVVGTVTITTSRAETGKTFTVNRHMEMNIKNNAVVFESTDIIDADSLYTLDSENKMTMPPNIQKSFDMPMAEVTATLKADSFHVTTNIPVMAAHTIPSEGKLMTTTSMFFLPRAVPFEGFKSRNYNFVDFARKAVGGYIPALMTQLPGREEEVAGPEGMVECYHHRLGSAHMMLNVWIAKEAPHQIVMLEQIYPQEQLKSIFKLVSRKFE